MFFPGIAQKVKQKNNKKMSSPILEEIF